MVGSIIDALRFVIESMGILQLQWQNIVMILIGSVFVYLGIKYEMEPLLLVPIGFTTILVNLPATGLTEVHGFFHIVYKYFICSRIPMPKWY